MMNGKWKVIPRNVTWEVKARAQPATPKTVYRLTLGRARSPLPRRSRKWEAKSGKREMKSEGTGIAFSKWKAECVSACKTYSVRTYRTVVDPRMSWSLVPVPLLPYGHPLPYGHTLAIWPLGTTFGRGRGPEKLLSCTFP